MKVSPKKAGAMMDCLFMLLDARGIKASDVEDWKTDATVRQAKRDVYVVSDPEMETSWKFLTELTESEYGMIADHLDDISED